MFALVTLDLGLRCCVIFFLLEEGVGGGGGWFRGGCWKLVESWECPSAVVEVEVFIQFCD